MTTPNNNNEAQAENDTALLQAVFDQVVARISSTTSGGSSTSSSVDNATKLRLYALYKYGTVGPPTTPSNSWSPTAMAKERAWQQIGETIDHDPQRAKIEYVQLASSLDETCRQFLEEYQQQLNTGKMEIEPTNNASSKGRDTLPTTSKEKSTYYTPGTATDKTRPNATNNPLGLFLIVWNFLIDIVLQHLPKPIIPRGGLDISWADLGFALRACIEAIFGGSLFGHGAARRRQLEEDTVTKIVDLCLGKASNKDKPKIDNKKMNQANEHNDVDVVVGYTVRSLLDLYLMHKQYPPQASKEVIVSPPITIPGMVQLLEHYGLVVVPVEGPGDENDIARIDVDAIASSVTDRTVAIMIVHPFGATSASSEDWVRLRALANQQSIELWEDAAESYRGLAADNTDNSNHEATKKQPNEKIGCSSPHADITFVSFGLIKTATALGGGIAVIRDHRHEKDSASSRTLKHDLSAPYRAAVAMRRLQQHHYSEQTVWDYCSGKILQAILIQVFSLHPRLYGVFVSLCIQWGGYDFFDRMVTRNVRSIVPSASKSSSTTIHWMESIRKRPSLPLLQLLHRRLLHSRATSCRVERRIQQCRDMAKIFQVHARGVGLPSATSLPSAYWLYPIQVDPTKKQLVQERILKSGWDIAAGTSQLQCVLPTLPSSDMPFKTQGFMSNVLYLPVASRSLTRQQCVSLAKSIQRALDTECNAPSNNSPKHVQEKGGMFSFVGICLAMWFLPLFVASAIVLLGYGIACTIFIGYGLQWLCGLMYLESSNGFARYISMLGEKPLAKDRPERIQDEDANTSQDPTESESNIGVIDSIAPLQLPKVARLSAKGDFRGYAILTGATGFCGSLILRDLLLHRKRLNLSAGVYVICRGKRCKSAEQRVADLLQEDMFSFLTQAERSNLVHVLEGDVTKPNANLSDQDIGTLQMLPAQNAILTRVIHAAASVSFTQELEDAAKTNIAAALNMQALTKRLGRMLQEHENTKSVRIPEFVHISTAFVHGAGSGTKEEPLPQRLFSLGPYQPVKLFESMLGTQFYASKAMSDLRFTNTYAFTKCICEHLLMQRSHESQLAVPTLIIRPSIVGPAVENPEEGWAGRKPSTIVAAGCLYLSYQWNLWCFGSSHVPCIPVDVLSRFVLTKAFGPGQSPTEAANSDVDDSIAESTSTEDSFERIPGNDSVQSPSNCSSQYQEIDAAFSHGTQIYTAAWNPSSDTKAMFTWLNYCGATLHMGAVWGYFYRSTAYIGLWVTSRLMPRFQLSLETYILVHNIVVQLPMKALLKFCRAVQWKKQEQSLSKLCSFLDLPLLFFPYMNTTFYFESDLAAPGCMCGDRYVFSCVVAAHRFVDALKRKAAISMKHHEKTSLRKSHTENAPPQYPEVFLIGGKMHQQKFNLWWALTQPAGSPLIRIAGWVFAMILKATCHGLSVDLSSFELALKQRRALETAQKNGATVHVVLAPTHRSFFDFVILSYLVFAIPELQLRIPAVASADEFASLPVIGWLVRWLGAFYIRRGRGVVDPDLKAKVTSEKQRGAAVFEVFIEGSRSRDRRFVTPKTGFLRSLKDSGGRHLIVPIAISYERLPEQDILAAEAATLCGKAGLKAGGLFWWLKDVCEGKVSLGRIHVAAGKSSMLECKSSSDYATLARNIQLQQQEMTVHSNYHCNAASRFLGLDLDTVRTAMSRIGCRPWPLHNSDTDVSLALTLPEDSSELCTIMLQMAHNISGLCMESHKEWALWLNCVAVDNTCRKLCPADRSTAALAQSFISILSAADTQVKHARERLALNGFQQPTTSHLLQTASKNSTDRCTPTIILGAAASILQARITTDNGIEDTSNTDTIMCLPKSPVLLESGERLGFWGFHDSGFALQVTKNGAYKVTMRGGRYSLSGKSLSKLLPFVESETNVRIDPFNEAFVRSPRGFANVGALMESSFSAESMQQLHSIVSKFSLSMDDRVRHGTGQSQEDIFAIRNRLDGNFRIPDAVVWPTSEAEVTELISFAKLQKLCLIPFGGGTNVSNATRCPSKDVEPRPILSVDMSRLNRLLWLNEEDGLACVEAGINGRDLVDALKRRGYSMGHEPDSYEFSTLGGWIATKASGMKRNKYGNIEDIVRDIRVATSDGLVTEKSENDIKLNSAFGRESCGIDFRSLLLGSEGCLGIVTSAIVKVWPLPEAQHYDSVLLTSFPQGLNFVRDIAKLDRMVPVSVRLLDNEHFRLGQALQADPSSAFESMAHSLQKIVASISMSTLDPKSVVCTTICYEGSKIEVQQQKAAVLQLVKRHGGILLGPSIGRAGYDLTFMIAYLRDFAMTYHFLGESFETFAPWSKVESIIQNTKKIIQKEHNDRSLPGIPFVGCRVTQLYHDGACLYFYFCMNTQNVKDASKVFAGIEHEARAEIMRSGGSLSHHHGVGKVRAEFLRASTSPAFQKIVSNIKGSLDPENIFAAGNGLFGVE